MSKPTVADTGAVRFMGTAVEGAILSQRLRVTGQRREYLPNARFALCTGGSVEVLYRGSREVMSRGGVALLEAGETATARTLAPTSAWVLDVTPGAILRTVGHPLHVGAPHFVTTSPLTRAFADLVGSITRDDTPLEQSKRFVAFVGVAARDGELQLGAKRPSAPLHLRRVREILDHRFAESLTLEDLADYARLNPLYLVRAFHGAFGMPPHEYQLNARVHRACELLRARRPASEVAVCVGFSDLSHLTRHFKRLIGVPPGAFARAVTRRGSAGNTCKDCPSATSL
jgi:AraC-like DNA-binding protein